MMDLDTRRWCREQAIKATAENFRIAVMRGERPWEHWSQAKQLAAAQSEPGGNHRGNRMNTPDYSWLGYLRKRLSV